MYWDASGGSFVAMPVANAMTEVDAVSQPGYYRIDVTSSALDMVLGAGGYEYSVTETTNSVYQNVVVEVIDEVATYSITGPTTAEATMADGHQYVQFNTTAVIGLSLVSNQYGKGGAFSVGSAVLKTTRCRRSPRLPATILSSSVVLRVWGTPRPPRRLRCSVPAAGRPGKTSTSCPWMTRHRSLWDSS